MSTYRVTATLLRIRSGPGTNYATIGMLLQNDIIEGSEVTNQWVHIATSNNKTGWSHGDYLVQQEGTPPPPPAPEPTSGQAMFRIDASSLNLRQGPGTNYPVVGSLKKSEMVQGLAISSDGGWAQVRTTTGLTGWASLNYMTRVTAPPPPSPNDIQMIVTTDALNVRSGPGTGYSVIDKVDRGEKVVYLSATPDWAWVNIKTNQNNVGWCSSQYLTEQGDLFASSADYAATGLHRVLTDTRSLRVGPSEETPKVADMPFNRVVFVKEISADGKWKHCTNAWGQSGWYPVERLQPLGDVAKPRSTEEYPWLPLAFAEFGTREIPGAQHNPRILEYINSTSLSQQYSSLPDETDWCASFINWCIEKVGLPSTNSALATSWRSWGKAIPEIKRGAVTTFLWDNGGAHVSFYLGDIGNYVVCLGGNQSDAVWISVYHKKYVKSYRAY